MHSADASISHWVDRVITECHYFISQKGEKEAGLFQKTMNDDSELSNQLFEELKVIFISKSGLIDMIEFVPTLYDGLSSFFSCCYSGITTPTAKKKQNGPTFAR